MDIRAGTKTSLKTINDTALNTCISIPIIVHPPFAPPNERIAMWPMHKLSNTNTGAAHSHAIAFRAHLLHACAAHCCLDSHVRTSARCSGFATVQRHVTRRQTEWHANGKMQMSHNMHCAMRLTNASKYTNGSKMHTQSVHHPHTTHTYLASFACVASHVVWRRRCTNVDVQSDVWKCEIVLSLFAVQATSGLSDLCACVACRRNDRQYGSSLAHYLWGSVCISVVGVEPSV